MSTPKPITLEQAPFDRTAFTDEEFDEIVRLGIAARARIGTPLTDQLLRSMWVERGGDFHGPNVETGTMPEDDLLPFLRELINGPRLPVAYIAAHDLKRLKKSETTSWISSAPSPDAIALYRGNDDADENESNVHVFPERLEALSKGLGPVTAYSVAVGSPDGRSVPLFVQSAT